METITFEDFVKVEIRVGQIVDAERVVKSDKLLKLQVDFGELGIRQIVAGIGKLYQPVGDGSTITIIGLTVMAVVNLTPRKLMGLESHGMLLAAPTTEGELPKLPDCSGMKLGAIVG